MQFSFNARVDTNGSVIGQANYETKLDGDLVAHIDIDCLFVTGNKAYISGIVTEADDPGSIGLILARAVVDNGEGRSAGVNRTTQLFNVTGSGGCQDPFIRFILDLVLGDEANSENWTNGQVQVN
jgi:hypothetical protein